MKVTMNTGLTPFFSGTYESVWEPREYDEECEEREVEYKHADLMRSIIIAYKQMEERIADELPEFVSGIKFKDTFFSPREYNFSTDSLDYVLTINRAKLLKELKALRGNEKFAEYLKENYSSRDGFWSYTPNNYFDLYHSILNNADDLKQSLAALINFLSGDEFRDIEESAFDYWQGNGYCGLDYKVIESETV